MLMGAVAQAEEKAAESAAAAEEPENECVLRDPKVRAVPNRWPGSIS